MEYLAQGIGIVAMAGNILSYQCKSRKNMLILQVIGPGLFAVNMLLLGATMGFLLNTLAVVRALVYMQTDLLGKHVKYINWAFGVAYVICYCLTFTLFGTLLTVGNCVLELLPLIGMIAMTIGYSKGTPKAIRMCAFINSPCWLIYNCINMAVGGILCECISLVSVVSAFLRLDVGKKNT